MTDGTKTECSSESGDRYYDSMDMPELEKISEWIASQIEPARPRIGGVVITREHFKEDTWPDDPQEIADEIASFIGNYNVLVEVFLLLALNYRRND